MSSKPDLRPQDVPDRAARVRYRRAMALVLMTLVVPGSAQLVAGNRRVARIATRTWAASLVVLVLLALTAVLSPGAVLWLATRSWLLFLLRLVLVALAVGWTYLVVDAWRLGEPLSLTRNHRRTVVGTSAVTALAVLTVTLFSAHVVGVQRGLIRDIGGSGPVHGSAEGRHNVLLAGGDSGAGRVGLRPDSLTVASIDAETGKTVLVGLPRNMSNFTFPKGSVMAKQFPDGWSCDDCMLNAVSTWASDHPDLFGDAENPGMAATVEAVEGITGLEIGYWALVNLKGFHKLVDAFGGVELNVRDRIPVGLPHDDFFHYIEPGVRKLDGEDTLWFARARHGSDDYSRMARQKCVMGALLQQVNPTKALVNIGKIADASSAMLSTSIPSKELDTFVSLALKARKEKIATVSLVPPAINTGNPDLVKAQRMVKKAIDRAEGRATKAKKKATSGGGSSSGAQPASESASPSAPAGGDDLPVTGGSKGSLKTGYAANEADDLANSC